MDTVSEPTPSLEAPNETPSETPLLADRPLMRPGEREAARRELFANLTRDRDRLADLAERAAGWAYEDGFYRFYHQSFKVYYLQDLTAEMVAALTDAAPAGTSLDEFFTTIISEGTNKVFDRSHNRRWLAETRPILEAFTHARYMITEAARFASLDAYPEGMIPSGWAALTTLYGIR